MKQEFTLSGHDCKGNSGDRVDRGNDMLIRPGNLSGHCCENPRKLGAAFKQWPGEWTGDEGKVAWTGLCAGGEGFFLP